MRDLVAAEWIKLRSLRSTGWTVGLTALAVITSAVVSARAEYAAIPGYSVSNQREHWFALSDAFPLMGAMIIMVVTVGSGAAMIVGEYATGMIRTTLTAVPARSQVIFAKATVLVAMWAATGAVAAVVSFSISQSILGLRDAAADAGDPATFAALGAATLLPAVCALIGLGLGVLIRHGVGTAVAGIMLLLLFPLMFSTDRPLTAKIQHATVLSAWQRLTVTYGDPASVGNHYAPFAQSWIVLATWPLLTLLLAMIVIRRRDV
jgi:ABC-2 type transport system permease protein